MKTARKRTKKDAVKMFKILSDPTRFRIIWTLVFGSEELCVNEIAEEVGASQSATSHQLSKLESEGIVKSSRDGVMVCYVIRDDHLKRKLRQAINLFS